MKKLFLLFPLLLLSCGIYFYPVASVSADGEGESDQKEIDITLSPQDVLFAINDMKPGDWAPRTLAVKNTGSKDFAYQMSVENKGEKKLFNELMLEVSVGEKELYRGKLAAFTSLPARNLARGSTESLDITIRFPEHLGNDFQGTDSLFAFIFTAEGEDGDSESVTIPGEVGSGGGEKAPGTTPDPTDEKSGSVTPDEPSSDSDLTSPDDPSSDSESVPHEESSTKNDPPESSSSTSSLPNLPGPSDSKAKTPTTSILPATSTNIFNLVLFGSILVTFGIVLMLVMHYRRLKLLGK
jgi:hypothetical protein